MTTPTLKESIKEFHDEAESHRFAKYLVSGQISKKAYADYLFNQYHIYKALEEQADSIGILADISSIKRADLILQDYNELGIKGKKHPTTERYETYVKKVPVQELIAHIYVRHFGDMFGGAIIKTKVPGSGKMYEFENKKELIEHVRAKLDISLSGEAALVFMAATNLFEELANEHNI